MTVTQLQGQDTEHTDLILSINELIKTEHKFIIVDNVNHLSGTIAQQLETFRAIMNLVTNKDCHAILVVQPTKIDANKMEVNSGDMKGFSEIIQGVFNHINVCRVENNDEARMLHVEKCRNNGPGSRAYVYVLYDQNNNLYNETSTLRLKKKNFKLLHTR